MNPYRLTTHSTRAAIEWLSSFFYPLNIGWIRAAALIRALAARATEAGCVAFAARQ
jgi:hypothetical protein